MVGTESSGTASSFLQNWDRTRRLLDCSPNPLRSVLHVALFLFLSFEGMWLFFSSTRIISWTLRAYFLSLFSCTGNLV